MPYVMGLRLKQRAAIEFLKAERVKVFHLYDYYIYILYIIYIYIYIYITLYNYMFFSDIA